MKAVVKLTILFIFLTLLTAFLIFNSFVIPVFALFSNTTINTNTGFETGAAPTATNWTNSIQQIWANGTANTQTTAKRTGGCLVGSGCMEAYLLAKGANADDDERQAIGSQQNSTVFTENITLTDPVYVNFSIKYNEISQTAGGVWGGGGIFVDLTMLQSRPYNYSISNNSANANVTNPTNSFDKDANDTTTWANVNATALGVQAFLYLNFSNATTSSVFFHTRKSIETAGSAFAVHFLNSTGSWLTIEQNASNITDFETVATNLNSTWLQSDNVFAMRFLAFGSTGGFANLSVSDAHLVPNKPLYLEYVHRAYGTPPAAQTNITNHCIVEINTTNAITGVWFNYTRNLTADFAGCNSTYNWLSSLSFANISNISVGVMQLTNSSVAAGINPTINATLDDVFLIKTDRFGNVNITINTPTEGATTDVTQNTTFNFNATIGCFGDGNCGKVKVTPRMNLSGASPAVIINGSTSGNPFYVSDNVQETILVSNFNKTYNATPQATCSGDPDVSCSPQTFRCASATGPACTADAVGFGKSLFYYSDSSCPTAGACDNSCGQAQTGGNKGRNYIIKYDISNFNLAQILDANISVTIGSANSTINVAVYHVNEPGGDSTSCSIIHSGEDTAAQPSLQTGAAALNFSITSHLQGSINNKKTTFTVMISSTNNANSNSNLINNATLLVKYVPVEKSCTLNLGQTCLLNWTINATGSQNSIWAIDINTSSSNGNTPANNSADFYVRITVGATLKDEIRSPCSTSITTAGDNCTPKLNPRMNTDFNVSFRFRNSTTTAGTFDKTLKLQYGRSTHPRTNQANTNIPYNASGCGGPGQLAIMTASPSVDACSGATCSNTTNPDFRILQTAATAGYDANITFQLRFCPGTEGIAYDLAIGSNASGTGTMSSDSFINIIPYVIILWNKSTNNFIESSPAVGNLNGDSYQDVVIGSDDYNFYAISGNNGTQLWSFPTTNSPVIGAPGLADLDGDGTLDVVFGTCSNESTAGTTYSNKVFALNGSNGSQKWNFSTGGCVLSSPAIANLTVGGTKYVFISSFDDKKVWAVFANNGSQAWSFGGGSTATYLPDTNINKAYYTNSDPNSNPNSATTALADADYSNVNTSNNAYLSSVTTVSSVVTRYTHQRFTFNLSGISDITQLKYTWEGKWNATGENNSVINIKYRNQTSEAWTNDGNSIAYNSEGTFTKTFTSNFNDWVNSTNGLFEFSATASATFTEGPSTTLRVYTDFVKLEVTTGGAIAGNFVASPTLSDGITGDSGKPEVFIGSYDGNMYALNATDGSKIWNYTVGSNRIETTPAVDDVDNNGTKSVVFASSNGTVFQLNAANGALEKKCISCAGTASIVSSPVIANVQTDDSDKEVIIGTPEGKVVVLNGTNSTSTFVALWNFTIPTGGRADSSPAVADIDNDTFSDVVIGGSDGYLYALRGIDGVQLWNLSVGGNIPGSPAIADTNNNGENEIIVGSFAKNLTTIDPGGVTPIESGWSMYGGNQQRTRLLDDTAPERISFSITNTTTSSGQYSVIIRSHWKDSFSTLSYALMEENSTGEKISYKLPFNGNDQDFNYVFSPLTLKQNQLILYNISVFDAYSNKNSISGSFIVGGKTEKATCGDNICSLGESLLCPQDCQSQNQTQPLETIKHAIDKIRESIPEAGKSLIPLIIAAILIIVIIYVFVI